MSRAHGAAHQGPSSRTSALTRSVRSVRSASASGTRSDTNSQAHHSAVNRTAPVSVHHHPCAATEGRHPSNPRQPPQWLCGPGRACFSRPPDRFAPDGAKERDATRRHTDDDERDRSDSGHDDQHELRRLAPAAGDVAAHKVCAIEDRSANPGHARLTALSGIAACRPGSSDCCSLAC